ncbi:MAG TPA: hypothetical protein VGK73_15740 [Polyangiaceae bacterium]
MTDSNDGPTLEDYSEHIDEKRAAWLLAKRAEFVAALEAEIGPQQKGSQQVFDYWRSALGPEWSGEDVWEYSRKKSWCGGFFLWGLHHVGVATDVYWLDGRGFVEPTKMPATRAPKPGDLAYFNQPYQHYACVVSTDLGKLVTIDGNQLKGVTKNTKPLPTWGMEKKGQCVFYSVQPLLLKALDA